MILNKNTSKSSKIKDKISMSIKTKSIYFNNVKIVYYILFLFFGICSTMGIHIPLNHCHHLIETLNLKFCIIWWEAYW